MILYQKTLLQAEHDSIGNCGGDYPLTTTDHEIIDSEFDSYLDYLCRKLREAGHTVVVMDESSSPGPCYHSDDREEIEAYNWLCCGFWEWFN